VIGAVVGAALALAAQATHQWVNWGCAACGGARCTVCVRPALWHWHDVQPSYVAIAAIIGAAIVLWLRALARRERERRRQAGEI